MIRAAQKSSYYGLHIEGQHLGGFSADKLAIMALQTTGAAAAVGQLL